MSERPTTTTTVPSPEAPAPAADETTTSPEVKARSLDRYTEGVPAIILELRALSAESAEAEKSGETLPTLNQLRGQIFTLNSLPQTVGSLHSIVNELPPVGGGFESHEDFAGLLPELSDDSKKQVLNAEQIALYSYLKSQSELNMAVLSVDFELLSKKTSAFRENPAREKVEFVIRDLNKGEGYATHPAVKKDFRLEAETLQKFLEIQEEGEEIDQGMLKEYTDLATGKVNNPERLAELKGKMADQKERNRTIAMASLILARRYPANKNDEVILNEVEYKTKTVEAREAKVKEAQLKATPEELAKAESDLATWRSGLGKAYLGRLTKVRKNLSKETDKKTEKTKQEYDDASLELFKTKNRNPVDAKERLDAMIAHVQAESATFMNEMDAKLYKKIKRTDVLKVKKLSDLKDKITVELPEGVMTPEKEAEVWKAVQGEFHAMIEGLITERHAGLRNKALAKASFGLVGVSRPEKKSPAATGSNDADQGEGVVAKAKGATKKGLTKVGEGAKKGVSAVVESGKGKGLRERAVGAWDSDRLQKTRKGIGWAATWFNKGFDKVTGFSPDDAMQNQAKYNKQKNKSAKKSK